MPHADAQLHETYPWDHNASQPVIPPVDPQVVPICKPRCGRCFPINRNKYSGTAGRHDWSVTLPCFQKQSDLLHGYMDSHRVCIQFSQDKTAGLLSASQSQAKRKVEKAGRGGGGFETTEPVSVHHNYSEESLLA